MRLHLIFLHHDVFKKLNNQILMHFIQYLERQTFVCTILQFKHHYLFERLDIDRLTKAF